MAITSMKFFLQMNDSLRKTDKVSPYAYEICYAGKKYRFGFLQTKSRIAGAGDRILFHVFEPDKAAFPESEHITPVMFDDGTIRLCVRTERKELHVEKAIWLAAEFDAEEVCFADERMLIAFNIFLKEENHEER